MDNGVKGLAPYLFHACTGVPSANRAILLTLELSSARKADNRFIAT